MNHIKKLREEAGISQAKLRRELGWSQPRLANYESFLRTPGLDESRRIVAALQKLGIDCTLDDVFPEKIESVA